MKRENKSKNFNKNKSSKKYNIFQQQNEQEDDYEPIGFSDYNNPNNKKIKINKNCVLRMLAYILLISIFIVFIIYTIYYFKAKKAINDINSNYTSKYEQINQINKNIKKEIEPLEINKKVNESIKEKIGVAFVFKNIFGNGIGRMLSLLCSELSHIEKYDIYLITGGGTSYDFPFDEKVKIVRIAGNKTLIENYDKTSNIKIYVLHNDLTPSSIKWYQSLNGGKKVIGIMHGVYMSSIYSNQTGVYAIWKNNKLYDAYVQVISDDYYVNKKLGINNSFFIPNLYTFNPSTTPNSNLTNLNLMIMGRELDKIKGGLYGIKAMDIIRREIPNAKLYFISANYKIEYLENLIKELNLTNNIEILHYTKNISHYFLNSSVLLYPSLSEASPLVMNEGKAHGLPIVAFNVSYSNPYQKGVILVENTNYGKMAEEAIKLLKDYNYRKLKGLESKLSLNEFSNKETVDKWDRLFMVLLKNDPIEYKKLQEYTFERYYDEEKARDHLESSWNKGKEFNRYFCCHDFNDMLNIDYINNIKPCLDQSLCK